MNPGWNIVSPKWPRREELAKARLTGGPLPEPARRLGRPVRARAMPRVVCEPARAVRGRGGPRRAG